MPTTPPSANLLTLNGHVLVVDDAFVNLKMMQLFLREMGFTVDTALDGALAVTALEKVPYDLVLMDCNMPVLDGFEPLGLFVTHQAACLTMPYPLLPLLRMLCPIALIDV